MRQRFNSTGSEDCGSVEQLHKPRMGQPGHQQVLEKFDMRTAKHDVKMFGITGMGKEDKAKAKLEVMMKLGAKVYINKYDTNHLGHR